MKCKAIQSFLRDHLYLRISLLMGMVSSIMTVLCFKGH